MKFERNLKYLVLLSLWLVVGACGIERNLRLSYRIKTQVEDHLTLRADRIKGTFKIAVPTDLKLSHKFQYNRKFYFQYDTGLVVNVFVGGINLNDLNEQASVNVDIPYDSLKIRGSLYSLDSIVRTRNAHFIRGNRKEVDSHIDLFALLASKVNVEPITLQLGAQNNSEELEPHVSGFYFQKNSAILNDKLKNPLNDLFFNETDTVARLKIVRMISILTYAAPDEILPDRLSAQRAQEVEKYIRTNSLQYLKQTKLDSTLIFKKPLGWDISRFKTILSELHDIPDSVKLGYLPILNADIATNLMLSQMKMLPSYEKIRSLVFPRMRCAVIEILTIKEKKTDAEIYAQAKEIIRGKSPLTILTKDEILYVGTLISDIDDRRKFYQAVLEKMDIPEIRGNLAALELSSYQRTSDTTHLAGAIKILEDSDSPSFQSKFNSALALSLSNDVESSDQVLSSLFASASSPDETKAVRLLDLSNKFRQGKSDEILNLNSTNASAQEKVMRVASYSRSSQWAKAIQLSDEVDLAQLSTQEMAVLKYNKAKAIFASVQTQNNSITVREALVKATLDNNAQLAKAINETIELDKTMESYVYADKTLANMKPDLVPWRPPQTLKNNFLSVNQMALKQMRVENLLAKIEAALQAGEYENIKVFNIPDQKGFMVLHALEKFEPNGKSAKRSRFSQNFLPWSELTFKEMVTAPFVTQVNYYRTFVFIFTNQEGPIVNTDTEITSKEFENFLLPSQTNVNDRPISGNERLFVLVYEFKQLEGEDNFQLTKTDVDWNTHIKESQLYKHLTSTK